MTTLDARRTALRGRSLDLAWPRVLLVGAWLVLAFVAGVLGATLSAVVLVIAPLAIAAAALFLKQPLEGGLPVKVTLLLMFVLYADVLTVGVQDLGLPPIAQALPFLLVAAMIFLLRTAEGRSRSLQTRAGFWTASALYAAVLLASAVWAPDGAGAIKQAESQVESLVLVYIIVETFDTPQRLRLALWSLIGAGSLLAGLSVLQVVTHNYGSTFGSLANAMAIQGDTAPGSADFRSGGPFGDPNLYGLIVAALVPLALSRIRDESSWILRSLAAASTLLLLAAVVLTYSRGAMLSLALVVVLYIALARVRLAYVVGAGVVVLLLFSALPSKYLWIRVDRLTQVLSMPTAPGAGVEPSIEERAGAVKVALTMFEDHPIFGVGAGSYSAADHPYALRLNVPSAASPVHDLYLQLAAETGLLGLLSFGCAMILILRAGWRQIMTARRQGDRAAEGLATACLLALATCLIGFAFLPADYLRYLWTMVGLVLASTMPVTKSPVALHPGQT